jgi:hypothetical protein
VEKEMKLNTKYECLNQKCGTYIFGTGKYLDGLNCPRCNGPVTPMPFEIQSNLICKGEMKMFDKEIVHKKELLEVIEALDKLDKNYVITKSKREISETAISSYKHEIDVWHVKEV